MNAVETLEKPPQARVRAPIVVCVDDDPDVLTSLERLLRSEPYEVRTTADPEQVLEWVENEDVSVVIADQRMPRMTGTELLEAVEDRRPTTTRVLLTGYVGNSFVNRVLPEGVQWLIAKPWSNEGVRLTLRQLLDRREPVEPPGPAGEQIRGEIERRFGFFPPFFAPALDAPRVLENLWRQTREAYLDNPLPSAFKERLFAYLSRFCKVPYFIVCHSCALSASGTKGAEIHAMLAEPVPPTERILVVLENLAGIPGTLPSWPASPSTLEENLFLCSVSLFQESATAERCRIELRRLLGPETHMHLLMFLAYVRMCHLWAEDHPGISYDGDRRAQEHLDPLIEEEPRLREFFASYAERNLQERVRREQDLVKEINALRESAGALRKARESLETRVRQRTAELVKSNEDLVREITERRKVEEELRQKTEILENAVEGIARLDSEGRILSVNRACAEMLGYAPEEMTGLEWTPLVHPDDRERAKAAYGRMSETGRACFEGRALRKGGDAFFHEVVMIKGLDRSGRFSGHYCFIRDITERKRAEEERAQLTAQLLQGQKMQAIGQLAAGIAHEINNPVGYISSNLSTMQEYFRDLARLLTASSDIVDRLAKGDDAGGAAREMERLRKDLDAEFLLKDFQKAVEESRQGAERIRDIVRSLGEFSHVDEGELRPADINKCLEDTLRICWNELKYKATVRREYSVLPRVPCYPRRIEQVFVNLLVNAAQAIQEKGEIVVSTREEDGHAVVRIADTGCGIAAEALKKIFEPFYTTKPVGKGTGLGLHVAYKIVQAHGGTIEVRSELGRGTTFTVRLPLPGPEKAKR
ncbi:MAG: PAS domain S-box protein [Planctomycetes bacterium]|nr:PAS domain S-box protein [Planctomycetota bacterium]